MLATKTNLRAVTRAAPCAVCAGNHKCSRGGDGLMLCGRRSGPQPGFVDLGAAKGDPQFHLYRSANDTALLIRERNHRIPPKVVFGSSPPACPAVDWADKAERFRRNLTPALADELCERLQLPRIALDALPGIGFDPTSGVWTFPEVDGRGEIVGIVRRFRTGRKMSMDRSKRGLTIPNNWRERDTPLFIVEGQSDTLALSLCAVSCIGRPSNTGGADMLAELLGDFPPDRPIIIMGENDQKPNGLWPGHDGAFRVASALSIKLGRRIARALPPDGAKDIRAWILAQNPILNVLDSFHTLGDTLCQF